MPFQLADTTAAAPTTLMVAPWGLPKSGKTSFALSFPAPIYLFNLDHSYKELLQTGKYEGKEIYVCNYPIPDEFDWDVCAPLLVRFRKEWNEAIQQASSRGGTVVQDKSSQFWHQLVSPTMVEKARQDRIAKYGSKADREDRRDYGIPNLMMDTMLKRPYDHENVNACYIMGSKENYSGSGSPLGTYKPHGYGETEAVVEIVLGLATDKNVVMGTINKSRFGLGFEGMQLASPTYDSLMAVLS